MTTTRSSVPISQVYARQLLQACEGYPLWYPPPYGNSIVHRTRGVRIGDVGHITMEGAFETLFNIRAGCDDPINNRGVPRNHEQLIVPESEIVKMSDLHSSGNPHKPYVIGNSLKQTSGIEIGGGADAQVVPVGAELKFESSWSTSEGALLHLPNGSTRFHCPSHKRFLDHALKHWHNWWEFATDELSRTVSGGLYLITGYDKTESWSVAAFTEASTDHQVSFGISAMTLATGSIGYSYSWDRSMPMARQREGPSTSLPTVTSQENQNALDRDANLFDAENPNPANCNQCIFIQGYRITPRTNVLGKRKDPLIIAVDSSSKPADLHLPSSSSSSNLFKSDRSWWPLGSGSSGGSGAGRQKVAQESERMRMDLDEFQIDSIPASSTILHPCDKINEQLLAMNPSTEVAITHDKHWFTMSKMLNNDYLRYISTFTKVDGEEAYLVIDEQLPLNASPDAPGDLQYQNSNLLNEQTYLGVRLLSLDGGHTGEMGPISQLRLLGGIMDRLASDLGKKYLRPCEWFDMIGGSGTGGLIAILLGRLEMTVEEATDAYLNLFPEVDEEAKGKMSVEKNKTKQFENGLERLMSQQSATWSSQNLLRPDEPTKCKVFVCAMDTNNLAFPVLFRSYRVRSNASPDCTLREAAQVTVAVPGEYHPVFIGNVIKQSYIAASHGFNNPTYLLLREAKGIFPDQCLSCIVSIGAGHPGVTSYPSSDHDMLARAVLQLSLDCEKVSQDISRRLSDIADLYIRLNVDQAMQWRLYNASSKVAVHTGSYLSRIEINNMVNTLVKSLSERKPKLSIKALGDAMEPTSTRLVPTRPSFNFTGRRDELSRLHTYFNSDKESCHIFVLYGRGGSGKTQLCAKFVEEAQLNTPQLFSEVFFIDGSTTYTIEHGLEAIAYDKRVGDSPGDALDWFQRHNNNWLIVFDNVDDPSINLTRLLPLCSSGNFLITTRNQDLAMLGTSLQVGNMALDDAVQLLLRSARESSSGTSQKLAADIVKELHCFALAITQAGAYICSCCSLRDYLNIYRGHRKAILIAHHDEGADFYHGAIYTAWSLVVVKLSPAAQKLLRLCSFIHYRGIPIEIFERASKHAIDGDIPDPKKSAQMFLQNFAPDGNTWDDTKFLSVVREIQSYSLLQYDYLNGNYTIHPLFHSWSQTLPTEDDPAQCMLTILALSIDDGKHPEQFPFRRSLIPHLDEIRRHVTSVDGTTASKFHSVYFEAGHWKDSEKLLNSVIADRLQKHGQEHSETLNSMADLALTLMNQGRWKEAEELDVAVLEVRKQILGDDHPDTLNSMSNLASALMNQGRWMEAEDLDVALIEAWKRLLGEEHPDTLNSMSNLASTLQYQGRWDEAAELEVAVIEARKRLLGEEHPDTLNSMSNLASTLMNQGRWEESEVLGIAVVKGRKRLLGEEHPATLNSIANLASTFLNQGRWIEAENLERSVLYSRKKLLGEEHPDTLASMANLALTYSKQSRWEEAERLDTVVLEARRRLFGDEHPATLTIMANLASTYSELNRFEEAEQLGLTVLEARKRVLGEEHPDTLQSMANFASTIWLQGKGVSRIAPEVTNME